MTDIDRLAQDLTDGAELLNAKRNLETLMNHLGSATQELTELELKDMAIVHASKQDGGLGLPLAPAARLSA